MKAFNIHYLGILISSIFMVSSIIFLLIYGVQHPEVKLLFHSIAGGLIFFSIIAHERYNIRYVKKYIDKNWMKGDTIVYTDDRWGRFLATQYVFEFIQNTESIIMLKLIKASGDPHESLKIGSLKEVYYSSRINDFECVGNHFHNKSLAYRSSESKQEILQSKIQ